MHDTLFEIETALLAAERNLATARLALQRVYRKCRQCQEPLEVGTDSAFCDWCEMFAAARETEPAA